MWSTFKNLANVAAEQANDLFEKLDNAVEMGDSEDDGEQEDHVVKDTKVNSDVETHEESTLEPPVAAVPSTPNGTEQLVSQAAPKASHYDDVSIDDLKITISNLQQQLSKSTASRQQHEATISQQRGEITSLQRDLENSAMEMQSLKQMLRETDIAQAAMRKEHEETMHSNEKLVLTVTSLQHTISNLQSEINDLNKTISDMKASHVTAQDTIQRLEYERDAVLNTASQQNKRQSEQMLRKSQEEIEGLRARVASLEQEKESCGFKSQTLAEQACQAEMESLGNENRTLAHSLAELEEKYAQLLQEVEVSRSSAAEMAASLRDGEEARVAAVENGEKLKLKLAEAEQAKDNMAQRVAKVEEQLSKKQDDYASEIALLRDRLINEVKAQQEAASQSDFSDKVMTLQVKNEALSANYEHCLQEIQLLVDEKKKLEEKVDESADVMRKLNDATKHLATLQEQIELLRAENSGLKQQAEMPTCIYENASTSDNVKQRVISLEEENQALKDNVVSATKSLVELQDTIAALTERLSVMQSDHIEREQALRDEVLIESAALAAKEEEMKSMEASLENKERIIDELRMQVDASTCDRDESTPGSENDVSQQISSLEEENQALKEQLEFATKSGHELQDTIAALTERLSVMQSDHIEREQALRDEVLIESAALAAKEEEMKSMEASLKNKGRECDELHGIIDELKKQIEVSRDEVNGRISKADCYIDELTHEIANLKEKNAKMNERLEDLQLQLLEASSESTNVVSLQAAVSEHLETIALLKKEIEESVAHASHLQEQVTACEITNAKTHENLSAAKMNCDSLQEEVDNLKDQIEAANAQVDKLTAEATDMRTELQTSAEKLARLADERNDIMAEKENLTKQLNHFFSQESSVATEMTSLSNQVEELQQENSSLQQALDEAEASMALHTDVDRQHQETIKKLHDQVQEARNDQNATSTAHKESIALYESQLKHLNGENEALLQQCRQLKEAKVKHDQAMQHMQSQCAKAEAEKSSLDENLLKATERAKSIEEEIAKLRSVSASSEQLRVEYDALKYDMKQQQQELEAKAEQLAIVQHECNDLREKLLEYEARDIKYEQKKKKEFENFRKHNEQLAALHQQISSMEADHMAACNNYQATIDSITVELASKVAELEAVQPHIESLNHLILELKSNAKHTESVTSSSSGDAVMVKAPKHHDDSSSEYSVVESPRESLNTRYDVAVHELQATKAELVHVEHRLSELESLCAVQAASVTKLETEKRNVIMQAESHSLRAKKDLSELEEERSRLDSENTRLEAQVRQLHSFINSKKGPGGSDIEGGFTEGHEDRKGELMGTHASVVQLWNALRSVCPGVMSKLGDKPPSIKSIIIVYGVIIHLVLWYVMQRSCPQNVP